MSLKDLPKSLVQAASEVVEKSTRSSDALAKKIISEGLAKMGIKNPKSLTEEQEKILYSWSKKEFERRQLEEASCGCDVQEDDMPGDSVFHKDGDENAEKKKELDEEDDAAEVSEEDEIEASDLKENLAIDSDELATNGAVGVTDAASQPPVHVDVLKDTNVITGDAEYRLFVQKNTNELPTIVPPVILPGAPTVEALRQIVEGLPFYGEAVESALVSASSVPSDSTVTEAYVQTPHDKKVVAAIKSATKSSEVEVDDYISGGIHVHEYIAQRSTGDQMYDTLYINCQEEPSKKVPGKMVWVIRRDDGDTPYDAIVSDPYPPGVEAKSLVALKAALAKLP